MVHSWVCHKCGCIRILNDGIPVGRDDSWSQVEVRTIAGFRAGKNKSSPINAGMIVFVDEVNCVGRWPGRQPVLDLTSEVARTATGG